MPKIILCRGIQGSGKTTWAKQWALEDPEHRVRFNNDDIRNMLGKYWVPSREDLVKSLRSVFLLSSMSCGLDIVIDNMNLNPKEIEYYNTILDSWNNPKGVVPDVVRPKYSLEFKDFFTPLQECIERDSKRPNPVGEEVIRKTYEKYKDILNV
jgi:predicted kinase|nr:MAG TPA: polynucleotide kinase [Caudoviricetes sp.]